MPDNNPLEGAEDYCAVEGTDINDTVNAWIDWVLSETNATITSIMNAMLKMIDHV